MSRPTDEACILWMELDGELYSPSLPLARASLDLVERDIWNCVYPGICRSIYRYGARQNGGGYCRDVTEEVAARLGRMSFAAQDEAKAEVRTFLDAMGVGRRADAEAPAFEMVSPEEPARRAPRTAAKRRSRAVSADEMRAQPQLKLPIAGGKSAAHVAGFAIESEQDDEIGVESLSLKDRRPTTEQKAGWEQFRRLIRSWEVIDGGRPEEGMSEAPPRRSAAGGR